MNIALAILVTIICSVPIIVAGLIKLLIPIPAAWRSISAFRDFTMYCWCEGLVLPLHLNPWLKWNVEGLEGLNKKNQYLLVSNHHNWVDIVTLCVLLRKHIPINKYFPKQQLAWAPFIGLACWALDIPFMRRYSCSYFIRHPECHGKNVEATRRSCEKFRTHLTTIVNLVEGLRFTEAKKHETCSPYDNLLPPEAAGIAMALSVLGSQFGRLLNIMLRYSKNSTESLYDTLSSRLTRITVCIDLVPTGEELYGDYVNDKSSKRGFQRWLNGLWEEEDRQLTDVMQDKEK